MTSIDPAAMQENACNELSKPINFLLHNLTVLKQLAIAGMFFQNLTEFTFKQCLIIQQMFNTLNRTTIYGLELLQQLQLLCLWLNSIQNQTIESHHSLLTLLKGLSTFIQPYRSVIYVMDLVILTFLINIALQFYIIIDYFIYKMYSQKHAKLEKFTKYFEQKSESLKSTSQIVYIFINCFNISLLIPFLELNYLAFTYELKGGQISAYTFISIYNILSCLGISFCLIFLMNESLTIKLRNFQNLRNTFTDYIQYFLILIMIILNDIGIPNDNYLVYTIIICLYNGISIKNSLNQQKIRWHNQFVILINCFPFIFSLMNTFSESQSRADSFCLLLFPLLAGSLISQLQRNDADSLLFQSNSHPHHLQYKLAFILYQKDQNKQKLNSELEFDRQVYIWHNHHIKSEQLEFDEKLYFKSVCDSFKRLLETNQKDASRFIYKLHSISVISELGYNTSALQQTGNILNENSTINSSEKQENKISQGSSKTHTLHSTYQLKHKQLSFIQRIKLEVLQEIISNQITEGFIKKENNNDETVTEIVKIFLATEILKKQNIQEIISIIQMKRQFLIDIQSLLNKNIKFLFNKAKKISLRMQKFETALQTSYSKFPNQQLQSIYSFYTGEIQGNYFKANQISILQQIKEYGEEISKATKLEINLFSSQTNYLICELESDLNITIKEKSNYCHQLFEYNQSQFSQINSVNFLLPYGFEDIHKKLVQIFLETGQSKFFRKCNANIAQTKSKFLKQFQFFFEINNMSTKNLQITAFIQEYPGSNDCQILINPDQCISGVTKNLFKVFRYRPQTMTQLNLIQFFYKQKITCLLPDFYKNNKIQDTLAEIYDGEEGNNSVRLRFLKESYVLKQLQDSNKFFDWENHQNIETYTATIDITRNEAFNEVYWKVNVSNIKISTITHTFTTIQSAAKSLKINKQIQSSMNISKEGEFNIPYIIDARQLNSKQSISDQLEKQQSYENRMIRILNSEIADEIQAPVIVLNNQIPFEDNQNVNFPSEIGQQLWSPKESCKVLMNTSQMKKQKQQYFFRSQQKESSFNIQIEQLNMIKSKKSEQIYNIEDDNNHVRKAIECQFNGRQNSDQIIDQVSISSSFGGFKRSKYFQKYLLYNYYQETNQFPLNFMIMMFFYFLVLLISFIYCLLIINNSEIDLNRFLSEIDMLSLKGAILGPISKYYCIIFQIASYIQNIYQFGDDPVQLGQQMEFATYQRNAAFIQLKNSFQEQMSNPYVQQFFIDQTVNVSFQVGFDQLEFRTISFRECLQLLVEAGYVFKQGHYNFWVSNLPHITYFSSNMFTYTEKLQQLTVDIQEYTFSRTYLVADKWLQLFIPFLLIVLILLMITFLVYRRYIVYYDFSLSFFQHMTKQQIQHEILRLKAISDIISQDVTIILNYQFDAILKDKYIQTQTNRESQIQSKYGVKKSRNKSKQLSIIPAIVYHSLSALLFIMFALIIQILVSKYLIDYRESVKYYRRLTDASIATSGVYAYRETLSYQHNDHSVYFYFKEEELKRLEQKYLEYMQDIINFQQNLEILDTFNQLMSNSFVNYFNKIKQSDICQYLSIEEQVVALIHCQNIYGGVMLQGLAATLVQIINNLQTEFSLTQFYNRKKFPNQEVEIGVITTEVLQQLLTYFKASLVKTTGDLIIQFKTISIIYIVYVFLQLMIVYRFVLNYFKAEFKTVRKFIQILPQQLIFTDNTFERQLRTFINQNQLI